MANFPSYPTRSFSETQKFFVLDPQTGTPSFVLGSDLVNQLTPNSNYVFAESTRATAQATDYQVGQLIQTAGSATAGDGLASGYLVVPSGDGDFPMDNGNELLVIRGDEFLREQLAQDPSTGNGANLVNGATIYVGSVAEGISGLSVPDGQQVIANGWHPDTDVGGQRLVYRASVLKSRHGVDGWSPTVPAVSAQAGTTAKDRLANYLAGAGETDPTGSGLFVILEDRPSALQFGAYRNGTDSDSTAMKHIAGVLDTEFYRFLYMPNYKGTYFVDETAVLVEPGVRIFGDAGPTYQRGTGKVGAIKFDDATFAGPIFDLGNFRTSGNPADQWTVEGLDFEPAGASAKQVDAILHTTQTNGPDRGVLIDKCSARGMHSLFAVAAETVTNSLANLKITNCNLSNNEYGVFADGSVLGLEFTGNQAEQNSGGAIYGKFGSGITIHDNMLEGQPTPITIFPPDVGNRPKVSIKRNYFEANSGAYLISLSGSVQSCEAEIGENFNAASSYDDFCILKKGGWRIQLTDRGTAVTIDGNSNVLFGSDIFPCGSDSYEIRSFSNGSGAEIQIEKHGQFLGRDRTDYDFITATGTDTLYTPYGVKTDGYKVTGSTKFFSLSAGTVTAGDVVVFSVLMRVDYNGTSNTQVQVFNASQTVNLGQVSDPQAVESNAMGGGWALVQYAVEMTADTTNNVLFRFFNFTGTAPGIEVAGIAARNYGPIPAGGKLEIFPITVF